MNAFGLLALNKQTTGESDTLLGVQYEVEDLDYLDATRAPGYPRLSNRMLKVRRVKASGTLTAGETVKWSTYGTIVAAAGDNDTPCGVVSYYAGSITSGNHFVMIEKGPATALSDGGSTLAVDDIVVAAAAGEVNKQTAAPADTTAAMIQVNSRVGRVMATVAATAHIAFRVDVDIR